MISSDICKIILAVILPPLGVFLERGCGGDFLINILLTILGYFPGIIHALYVPCLRRLIRYDLVLLPEQSISAPQQSAWAQARPATLPTPLSPCQTIPLVTK